MMVRSLSVDPPSAARRTLALPLTALAAVTWTHALAGPLRAASGLAPEQLAPAALALTASALGVALSTWFPAASRVRLALRAGVAGLVVWALTAWAHPTSWVAALSVLPAGVAAALLGGWLVSRLPESVERQARRRPVWSAAWLVGALLALAQVSRLATHASDPGSDWTLSTADPFYSQHECLNAYLYVAELNRLGDENVYDPAHYPGLTRDAEPHTEIAGMKVEDPYQYPPPFLLLPRLALAFSSDYAALRSLWLGLNLTLCLGAALALSGWVGGRAGWLSALATPAFLLAFPVLYDLQYGQFHLAAVALGVLGALALERGRRALGGGLLAVAIVSKLFPALLLLPLLMRRRFRDVAAALVGVVGLCVACLPVVGTEPFRAFAVEHLPRLADGRAFAFDQAWPEVADLIVAGNQGAYGVMRKLSALGVISPDSIWTSLAPRLYGLTLVGAALWLSRRREAGRAEQAIAWLSWLGLASLASTGAWTDYVPVTAIWLLLHLAPRVAARRPLALGLGLVFVLQATLIGTVPVGDWADANWLTPLSLLSALSLYATFAFGLFVARGPATALGRERSASKELTDWAAETDAVFGAPESRPGVPGV